MTSPAARRTDAVDRAFGVDNRRRILAEYFAEQSAGLHAENVWEHVYRLLLWVDPTIGLAHCYESDKCQPGKAWYSRSLRFHSWLGHSLAVPPLELHAQIDQMFRAALPDLASAEAGERAAAAAKHLGEYPSGSMPEPGDDPELIEVLETVLGLDLPGDVATQRSISSTIRGHLAIENKRKNLLGRGFEDTLAEVMTRLLPADWTVSTRVGLAEVPGFSVRGSELERAEVDLAAWDARGRRVLVSSKWSVRADRERQFESDFDDYVKANSAGPFDYVLVTNEFDAARLFSAATKVRGSGYLFDSVVHVQPQAVVEVYSDRLSSKPLEDWLQPAGTKAAYLPALLKHHRLQSLGAWLQELGAK